MTKAAARSYNDACAAAHALDLVGERWSLLVMRELTTGAKRFSDLRAGLPGISANVLTQKLERLEEIGVLRRRDLPPPAASKVYELTEWGMEAEPIFRVLGRWGARSPFHDPTKAFSAASLMLSLRTMFDAERAEGLAGVFGFRIGAETFRAVIGPDGIDMAPGPAEPADAVLEGTAQAVAGWLYGGETLAAMEAAGALRFEGDRDFAARFATCFPLPERVEAPSAPSGA